MKPLPTTAGGYSVIYADPPWQYTNKRTRSAAAKNYPVMTLAQLCDLPVAAIAAPDAALFLWVTWPFMPHAFKVADAWGFPDYKTAAIVWAKANAKSNSPFFRMGNWTRSNTEPCLLFTRGRPRRACASIPQFLWARRLRHSEKPPEARDRIAKLMGPTPRLEMFSRHKVPTWDRWGNEILK